MSTESMTPALDDDGSQQTEEPEARMPRSRSKDPGAEAAARRHQLREVETERDALMAQLDEARRTTVENLAARTITVTKHDPTANPVAVKRGDQSGERDVEYALHNPADLFEVLRLDSSAFMDDAGKVDPARVEASLRDAFEARPYLFKVSSSIPAHDPIRAALDRNGATASTAADPWHSVIRAAVSNDARE